MITIKLNIKACDDLDFIAKKQQNYSYAFRKLYSNFHKKGEEKFIAMLQKKFNLNEIEMRSLASDVATKISQTATNKADAEERIVDILDDIKELQDKEITKYITRSKFKKHNKVKELERSLPQNITFGGKETLRELTKLHNNKTPETLPDIEKKTKEWKEKRIIHSYILGEANRAGNRFFDFNFTENTVVYKPYKGKKVTIHYSVGKKYKKDLKKLDTFIISKSIPVTVNISTKQVCLSFDNEIFNGYSIDKIERKKEVKKIDKDEYSKQELQEIINKIYVKYYDDLRAKKLIGKNKSRYIAVDLNPDYIGYCVADKGVGGIEKIIEKGVIDLRELHVKLGLPSDHPDVLKQNNKRKYEVQNSWVKLFDIVSHYNCAYFIKEDIDNIGKNESMAAKEANRKIKNLWHRTITDWQIEKRCIALGIELIPINPVYTSFIGNLMYDNFDATNSAVEICRRGMFKFDEGMFYPQLTGEIFDTMSRLFEYQNIQIKPRDAQIFKNCSSWNQLYKIASNSGLRWRWDWDTVEKPYSVFSMNSVKSKVKIIRFIS